MESGSSAGAPRANERGQSQSYAIDFLRDGEYDSLFVVVVAVVEIVEGKEKMM